MNKKLNLNKIKILAISKNCKNLKKCSNIKNVQT
jgi:hypothetical protein